MKIKTHFLSLLKKSFVDYSDFRCGSNPRIFSILCQSGWIEVKIEHPWCSYKSVLMTFIWRHVAGGDYVPVRKQFTLLIRKNNILNRDALWKQGNSRNNLTQTDIACWCARILARDVRFEPKMGQIDDWPQAPNRTNPELYHIIFLKILDRWAQRYYI